MEWRQLPLFTSQVAYLAGPNGGTPGSGLGLRSKTHWRSHDRSCTAPVLSNMRKQLHKGPGRDFWLLGGNVSRVYPRVGGRRPTWCCFRLGYRIRPARTGHSPLSKRYDRLEFESVTFDTKGCDERATSVPGDSRTVTHTTLSRNVPLLDSRTEPFFLLIQFFPQTARQITPPTSQDFSAQVSSADKRRTQ
jgi:hypothetical protein